MMKNNNYNFRSIMLSVLLMATIILLSSYTSEADRNPNAKNEQLISLDTQNYSSDSLVARTYNSGFKQGELSWNSVSTASNGKIYYVLSTHNIKQGGKMFVYNPDMDQTKFLADLTKISGEENVKAVPQGKVHNNFYEFNGKLYFGTHVGYFEADENLERFASILPDGYEKYPGGHIMSYDLSSGKFKNLGIAPDGQGILDFILDRDREQIYAITWPNAYFIRYDMETGKLENFGKTSGNGEAGTPGKDYRVIGRSMFVYPKDGSVYFSTSEGNIFVYKPGTDSIGKVKGANLRLDYFGKWDPTQAGVYGYNWRRIVWSSDEKVAYGVEGKSEYLFRFNPSKPSINIVKRIASKPSQRSGMYVKHPYGYLGFDLGPKEKTIYYITEGPININGYQITTDKAKKMGIDNAVVGHLITYNIPTGMYIDHGPIYAENGSPITRAQSIAITSKAIYTLAEFERKGKRVVDLVKISNPLAKDYAKKSAIIK